MTVSNKYDLLVIGGGINGTGIACDAAGRGLSVMLCEADDLASATSSASSKLIHGGLRYLEHMEFRLVREALAEREVLLRKAPHFVWPLRFFLPHQPHQRSRLAIRAGLFLYDNLYRRKLIPGSSAVSPSTIGDGKVFQSHVKAGFAYWDCWVDDARLVVANARAASDFGARIETRMRVTDIRSVEDGWRVRTRPSDGNSEREVLAKVIINAAGPWADTVQDLAMATPERQIKNERRLRLVKGSHIVVPRLVDGEDALILQNPDGRIVFVLPYEQQYSLIGTTDVEFSGLPETVAISQDETRYLLDAVAHYLNVQLSSDDVLWSYSGVRALFDDAASQASKVTRDYKLEMDTSPSGSTMLSVLGGKITTYRALADDAVNRLSIVFPNLKPSWTASTPLPGGDLKRPTFESFVSDVAARRPNLPKQLVARIARRHGSLIEDVLGDASTVGDLGVYVGHDLYEREVRYMKANEWASTPTDVLWRRTKTGLHLSKPERSSAEQHLESLL